MLASDWKRTGPLTAVCTHVRVVRVS